MKVTLKFSRALRGIYKHLDEEMEITLEAGATARDALLAANFIEGTWGVLITGDRLCRANEELEDGQEIMVLPPVSGG
ncbi:MAG: MoaD/ThiS family protein [Firmicutes bacterium]|jgi:molybdopterin converting factor small subunit|nr:MoaD/ThiS family protein [Bacillota bacterium]